MLSEEDFELPGENEIKTDDFAATARVNLENGTIWL